MRFGVVVDSFIRFLLTQQRSGHNTIASYSSDLQQLQQWLQGKQIVEIEDCSIELLREFLRYLVEEEKLRQTSLRRKIATFKAFFAFGASRYAFPNHAQALLFPKTARLLPKALSQQQTDSLLAAVEQDMRPIGQRNKLLLYLLYATGVRVSELTSLTISSLDLEAGFVRVWGKGSKERSIPLVEPMRLQLLHYITIIRPQLLPAQVTTDYLLFSVQHGSVRPLTRQAIWSIVKSIGKGLIAAGVQLSPHVLRHTLATHLLQQGADLRSLQLLLGHEQLTTVQIYTQLQTNYLRSLYDAKHLRS